MRGDCLTLARRGLEVHCGISGKRGHEKARLWAGLDGSTHGLDNGGQIFNCLHVFLV
jgi:hypothetical protein